MKRGIIIFGLLFYIIALQCGPSGGLQIVQNGGSEVVGKVITSANEAVSNAALIAYLDTVPIDTVLSLSDGTYKFDSLQAGTYNFVIRAKFNSDSLFGFHGGINNTIIAPKGEAPHIVTVGNDTLYKPGKISGKVILDLGDTRFIWVGIRGTSYSAPTDPNGNFTISSVPRGIYIVSFVDVSSTYVETADSNVTVNPQQTTILPDKVMQYATGGFPPAPKGLIFQYDTIKGQVVLTWRKVNVADLRQYVINRKIDSQELFDSIAAVSKTDTSFTDILYQQSNDMLPHTIIYEVFSENQNITRSVNPSNLDTVNVISPSTLRTFVTLKLLPSANSDSATRTIAVNETGKIVAKFSNTIIAVKKLYWFMGTPDSLVRTSNFNAKSGLDTLKFTSKQIGVKSVYVKSVDANNGTWLDSIKFQTVQDVPVITNVSSDTSINYQTPFHCYVYVSHQFGLCTLSVDLNGDGKSEIKKAASSCDTLIPTIDSGLKKITIKISDTHGNSLNSSFTVAIVNVPVHDRWEECSPLANARRWLSTCVLNNKLYAIGGCKWNIVSQKLKPLNFVESFGAADSVWTACDTLKTGRYDFISGVYNNALYVFGGVGGKTGVTNSIEQYNPVANSWTIVGTMNFYRTKAASCVVGDKLFLFGGCVPLAGYDSICSSIYSYNFLANQWSELPARMTTPRFRFQAIPSNGKIYLIGGIGGANDIDGSKALSNVDVFDPVSNQCISGPKLPSARYEYAAVAIQDTIYVIGGTDATDSIYYSDILKLSPSGQTWSTKTTFPAPYFKGRAGLGAGVINGQIVIVGGGSTWINNEPTFAEPIARKYNP